MLRIVRIPIKFQPIAEPVKRKSLSSNEPYNGKSYNIHANGSLAQMKAVFERRLYGMSALRFGGEFLYYNDKSEFSNQYVSDLTTKVDDHLKAGFTEVDFYLTNALAAKLGGRVEHSSLLNKWNIVPRCLAGIQSGKQRTGIIGLWNFLSET